MNAVSRRIGRLANVAVCVLAAFGLSLVVRPVTATLTRTVGTVWPFSSVHCLAHSTPGCQDERPVAPHALAQR